MGTKRQIVASKVLKFAPILLDYDSSWMP